MDRRGEEGGATVVGLGLVLALLALAGALAGAGALAVAQAKARVAADLAAVAGAEELWRGGDACAAAAATAQANGARLRSCEIRLMDVEVVAVAASRAAVAVAGPVYEPVIVASAPSSAIAPALSSGELPLPHFGDWMHDGQPDSQRQERTASNVASIHSAKRSKPALEKPAPPGVPS